MKSIAIVTDSNCGMSPAQARELGVHMLPMPFFIDDKEYLEDIDMNQAEFSSIWSRIRDAAFLPHSRLRNLLQISGINSLKITMRSYISPCPADFPALCRQQGCFPKITMAAYAL